MKTMKLFLVFCIAVFIIAGCKKDEPVIPDEILPTISTNPSCDTEVSYGDTITFNWEMKGNLKNPIVSINGNFISNKTVGEYSLKVTGTIYFVAYCESLNGDQVPKKITITAKNIPPPPILPTGTLNASPSIILKDGSSTLTWEYHHGDSATIVSVPAGLPLRGIDSTGSRIVTPQETTIYTLTVYNKNGKITLGVTITVNQPIVPTNTDLLLLDRWYIDSIWIRENENDPWVLNYIGSSDTWKIYYIDGRINMYEIPNTLISCGIWSWSTNEKYILHGNEEFQKEEVQKLDSTVLFLVRKAACEPCINSFLFEKTKYSHLVKR